MTQNNTCHTILIHIEDLTQTQMAEMQIPAYIADHVRSCAACKALLDQQLALADRVDRWTVPEPKRHMDAGVMAQIAQLEHDKHPDVPTFWTDFKRALRSRIQVPASVAATIMILLAVSAAFNFSHLDRSTGIAQLTPNPANDMPTEHVQAVQTHAQTGDVFPATHELNVIGPWRSQSQYPASTMVIILGAPPLPWTDSLTQPAHTQGQSL